MPPDSTKTNRRARMALWFLKPASVTQPARQCASVKRPEPWGYGSNSAKLTALVVSVGQHKEDVLQQTEEVLLEEAGLYALIRVVRDVVDELEADAEEKTHIKCQWTQ